MQRQSLGSPVSKLQIHGGSQGGDNPKDGEEGDEKRADKKLLRPSSRSEKTIHLIPILTLFCFLVLYLVSHDPTQKDLTNVEGFQVLSISKAERVEMEDLRRSLEAEKSRALAIGRHRSLQEVGKAATRSRTSVLHRKLGDF